MKYLKKAKMYKLALEVCPDVPKLKDCEYKFYRGSEWLEWYTDEPCDDGYISWKVYRTGYFVSVEKVQHLDSEFKAVTLTRKTLIIMIINSKGEKSRMTLIPDFLLDAIDAYCSIAGTGEGYLFRDLKRGERLTANAVRLFFQDLKKACGVPRIHAHLLRHTFATSYLMGGGNLEFLRVFMGHTDYAVTKMYSKLAAEYKMLGADIYRLDDIFFARGY